MIDVLDIMEILNHVLDFMPISDQAFCAADVFEDGIINRLAGRTSCMKLNVSLSLNRDL